MNKIPIFRKGVFKFYLKQGPGWGILIGLPFFLMAFPQESTKNYIILGVILFFSIYIQMFLFRIIVLEWNFRRKRMKHLYSNRYSYLDHCGFSLNENFYFEGIFQGYNFIITPLILNKEDQKPVDYDIISAFYQSDSLSVEKENSLNGDYFIGELFFENQCVSYIPKDWQKPDFLENLDQIVQILNRESLKPISIDDWNALNLKTFVDETMKNKNASKKIFERFKPKKSEANFS